MARESALWQRCITGRKTLAAQGHHICLMRIENTAGTGHPDVEGCDDGIQLWIELKSELRPKRRTTPIRFKVRQSQSDWHKERSECGCRTNWILVQVGESSKAKLYLIAGRDYDKLVAPEDELELISWCDPLDSVAEVLVRAKGGWR